MTKPHRSPLHSVLNGIWFREGKGAASKEELEAFDQLSATDRDFVRQFEQAVQLGPQSGWGPDNGGISTRNLALPSINDLRRLCQSIATLDAILSPEWQWRYYSFNCHWTVGTMCASMRNGSGDDFFIHFSPVGALIKGFAHEYDMSPWSMVSRSYHGGAPGLWPGITDNVPTEFRAALQEPAFMWEATTFCVWRTYGDDRWRVGDIEFPPFGCCLQHDGVLLVGCVADPDGSNFLLSILDGNPQTYKEFADQYFGQEDGGPNDHPLTLIKHVFQQLPLTEEIVQQLNPKTHLAELEIEIYETIGYPRDCRMTHL
jgi:hypothetical protein